MSWNLTEKKSSIERKYGLVAIVMSFQVPKYVRKHLYCTVLPHLERTLIQIESELFKNKK